MGYLSWVEISKSALIHNAKQFRKILGTASLMAVVKSNAYGHGLVLTAQAVEPLVDWLGVASGSEALALREQKVKKPILVLNYYARGQVKLLVAKDISLVVYDIRQAQAVSIQAKKLKKTAKIHIKVGTGLSRLGVFAKDAVDFIKKVQKFPNIEIQGLFSHFASSEDDPGFTAVQLTHFRKIIENLEKEKIFIPIKHIACTASALSFPESHFDLARIGIGIYGLRSYKSIKNDLDLRPILSWKARILAVKELPAGVYIGYGRTYKTARKTKLAILPVGYFEGYDRRFSNLAEVLIHGKRCKVRGRVYMNLLSVDVTNVKNAKTGAEAVLLGKQGKEEVSADELATVAGTINYDIVTRINPILPRILVA